MSKWKYLAGVLLMLTVSARARIGLVVGEPFGSFGTMMPAGHASIYLDHLCAASPTQLRLCHPGEFGVVISRYHDLRNPKLDWLATPASVFFYGVEDPAQTPLTMTSSLEAELRETYRVAHLAAVAPDRMDRHGRVHAPPYGDWEESIGAAFDRTLFVYSIDTTSQQDADILWRLNDDRNQRRYGLGRANCADFANDLLASVLPAPIARNVLADFNMSSPKNLARQLDAYGKAHTELNLRVYEIPQVAGSIRRSRPLRGAAETFLTTKRYLVTLLVIQPEFILADWIVYEKKGRWKPGLDATILTPSDLLGDPGVAEPPSNLDASAPYSSASTSSRMASDGIGLTAK